MKEAFLNVLFDLRIMSLCVVVSQVIALASSADRGREVVSLHCASSRFAS
ncbi:MAG: hypothetical protein Q8N06_10440 [Hydrogenophaga sp.]|nr:hypothetical protein [Thiobacillus sp.]MDP3165851.1 hypothetical protein [Hydrogenophaga sp.]